MNTEQVKQHAHEYGHRLILEWAKIGLAVVEVLPVVGQALGLSEAEVDASADELMAVATYWKRKLEQGMEQIEAELSDPAKAQTLLEWAQQEVEKGRAEAELDERAEAQHAEALAFAIGLEE